MEIEKENKFIFKNLQPFKWFVLENFPFIEDDFDALTNWQLFCKIGKKIQEIINSQNTVGAQMENVTNAFIELQGIVNNFINDITGDFNDLKDWTEHYLENLDVQEEINNKLDEMAEDGTLETIVAHYIAGLGANVKSLGAKGDGVTDDTLAINDALQFCKNNNIATLIFPDGEYLITSKLIIDFSNIELKGTGKSILKYEGVGHNDYFIRAVGTDRDHPLTNIKIHDLILDGTNQPYKGGKTDETPLVTHTQPKYRGIYGIYFGHVTNSQIYNNTLIDIYGDGIVCSRCHSIKILHNNLRDCSGGNPRTGAESGYDSFGDGITCFSSFDCVMDGNTVINTRKYQDSNIATDIGTMCGRSGIEYEYGLARDGVNTHGSELFSDDECNGLVMTNNYVYGYTKGCHLENKVPSSVVSNTFIHNSIGILSSTHGYTNITNNHIDDDNCNVSIQSGYDDYSGGLAITNYTLERDISNFVVSNNVFKGKRPAIYVSKDNVIISNNTFFNDSSYGVFTRGSVSNLKILQNTFNNNGIYLYNSSRIDIINNIFENPNRMVLNSTTSTNVNVKNNKITNTLYFQGSNVCIVFDDNNFVTQEGFELNRSNRFIDIYQGTNVQFINNVAHLTNDDTCSLFTITNTSSNVIINNNAIYTNTTRTTPIIPLSGAVTILTIKDNKIFNAGYLLDFIRHSWNVAYLTIENNWIQNFLAYIYRQTSGSTNGKSYQNNNKGMLKFNNIPNGALSRFTNNYFNNGEIINNFNGGATTKGWRCTSSGFYVTTAWAETTNYTVGTYVLVDNKVYKCIVGGDSTVAPTGTTLGTIETTSDGLQWLYCGTVAVLESL